MHFSEDDLRAALKRKDPGPEFTQRVMATLRDRAKNSRLQHKPLLAWLLAFKSGPALAVTALALLLVVGALVGYGSYREHLRQQAEARRAEQQAVLALRITSEKLNHVFKKVNGAPPPQDDRIRRERL